MLPRVYWALGPLLSGPMNDGAPAYSHELWLASADYLTPTTLFLAEIGKSPEALKTMPTFFDSSNEVVEQYFAVSKDGTRVPNASQLS